MRLIFSTVHIEESHQAFPLASATLAASTKENFPDSQIKILDCYINKEIETYVNFIINENPKIVNFSVYLWNRNYIEKLCKAIKDKNPNIIITCGGPEVSGSIIDIKHADINIKGEGEIIYIKVINDILSGDYQKNYSAKLIPVLKDLPSPFGYDFVELDKYNGILWELSRGCPFKCSFCYESRGVSGVRRFSIERVKRELEIFANNGVSKIFVLDPTFNYKSDIAVEMLNMFIDIAPEIHYSIEIRSEFITPEIAYLLGQLNCSLQIGLQSSNKNVLKNINRTIDHEDFYDKILMLHENGVTYGFDIIYGLPGDNFEKYIESIDFAFSMNPNHMDMFNLAVLPGTELELDVEKFNINHQDCNPYLVIDTPHFSVTDMAKAKILAENIMTFYNDGKAVTWFNILLENLEITPSQFFIQLEQKGNNLLEYLELNIVNIFANHGIEKNICLLASDIAKLFYYYYELCDSGESVSVEFNYNPEMLFNELSRGISSFNDLVFIIENNKTRYNLYVENYQLRQVVQ